MKVTKVFYSACPCWTSFSRVQERVYISLDEILEGKPMGRKLLVLFWKIFPQANPAALILCLYSGPPPSSQSSQMDTAGDPDGPGQT